MPDSDYLGGFMEGQDQLPFIIEPYSKEDRLRDRESRPKLGLRRLTEDRKLVSIDIDIPIDENTVVKDKFDWDLGKDKLSTADFARQLVSSLGLSMEYGEKLKEQMLSQIMEHIKTHTRQPRVEETEERISALRFGQYGEDEMEKEENQKKRMSRIRRNEMKRTTVIQNVPSSRYLKEKKTCRHCKLENITPGYECKQCKLPFELSELLNLEDKRVKIAASYYEKVASKIPLLTYEAKKRHFDKEDFDSFYAIYNKIRNIFENCDELSRQNLAQVRYIMEKYHEYFLDGHFDFNDEDIVYEKDLRRDQRDDDNRPKRQRGRPRKVKIISEGLVPVSENMDEDSNEDDSEEEDDDNDSN